MEKFRADFYFHGYHILTATDKGVQGRLMKGTDRQKLHRRLARLAKEIAQMTNMDAKENDDANSLEGEDEGTRREPAGCESLQL